MIAANNISSVNASNLLSRGGIWMLQDWLSPMEFLQLRREAFDSITSAHKCIVREDNFASERGGKPIRKFHSANGQAVQSGIYYSEEHLKHLTAVTGLYIRPSGLRGSYTYYVSKGDGLGLHRDIEICDLAVITALYENIPADSRGGVLCVYPTRYDEPLAQINANPQSGIMAVRLHAGQSVAILGGIIPHKVLPVKEKEKRVISVLCYKVVV